MASRPSSSQAPKMTFFPNLNSLCAEAQQVITIHAGGSLSSLYINWRIQAMTLQFSPDYQNLNPACTGCSWQVADFCLTVQKLKFGHSLPTHREQTIIHPQHSPVRVFLSFSSLQRSRNPPELNTVTAKTENPVNEM